MAEKKVPPAPQPPKEALQEYEDAKKRKLEEQAPTTKTEMGKPFKKGGSIRGGGCEVKGKTKGRFV